MNDTVDKIVTSYFAAFNVHPFTYKGRTYRPRPLRVSPALARGLICPEQCGACCGLRFSLDYLPFEDWPYPLPSRPIVINDREFLVHSDLQQTTGLWHCRHVDAGSGRCNIHASRPFSCDFEIVRLKHFTSLEAPNQLLTGPYGRAWALKRIVDNERGAKCEIMPQSYENALEAARKLRRLALWMEYFKLPHRVNAVVDWLEHGEYRDNAPLMV